MLPLPIPDPRSGIRYRDIRWFAHSLGTFVSSLTDHRVRPSHGAHLDPDLVRESLPRHDDWRPLFGQMGVAQGHLNRHGVGPGDLFLFFGLFQKTVLCGGSLAWDRTARRRHVLWGWLQVGEVLRLDGCPHPGYEWSAYHPHFQYGSERNNTLYVARRHLELPGIAHGRLSGAGTFSHFSQNLQLTDPDSPRPSRWRLPRWCHPRDGDVPLSYHSNRERWRRTAGGTSLQAVARGQEFVIDTGAFPEAVAWAGKLVRTGQ